MKDTKVRIYGKTLNVWKVTDDDRPRVPIIRQVEVEYKDYDIETGELVGEGSEDFSKERYEDLVYKLVWIWGGERRNAGGHRWFELIRQVGYMKGKAGDVKRFLKAVHSEAQAIELR